jgi:hypothetical protein
MDNSHLFEKGALSAFTSTKEKYFDLVSIFFSPRFEKQKNSGTVNHQPILYRKI